MGRLKGAPVDAKLLEAVRTANREFRDFVEKFSEPSLTQGQCTEAARRLGRISLRLKQLERLLARRAEGDREANDINQAIVEYQENLKALKGIVETLQSSLLERKSRFEDAHTHLQAARAWATSLRQIT